MVVSVIQYQPSAHFLCPQRRSTTAPKFLGSETGGLWAALLFPEQARLCVQ